MSISVSARELHQNTIVVDAHCDTLTDLLKKRRSLNQLSTAGHLDLPRMKAGGINLQFFAAFISPEFKYTALSRTMEIIDLFYSEMELNSEDIVPVKNAESIYKVIEEGKIAALLTIEGGEALMGELYNLRMLYRIGVRGLTLTWNGRNELADGVGEQYTGGGLTGFGKAVVQEMNRLGMIIDVSHISERGFWDVLDLSSTAVIASHSNCKNICDHPRNLTDAQIVALAQKGGVVGLSFVPQFISSTHGDLDKFLNHVDHIACLAGVDCIGLGSDFDGIDNVAKGLEDGTKLPDITEGLLKRGYREEDIKKILGGNLLRVISNILR
ncbi:dipeptidase [Desulfolucanica intricata]|uniref:dipeptidase n=1 Tax=Desulfolucanica intricata TaxID=1285191 RepID=UPI000A8401BD|nr:dipeptidase [Desulfolucanica intricata]